VRASLEYSFLPPSEKSAEEKQLEASFTRFEGGFAAPTKAEKGSVRRKQP